MTKIVQDWRHADGAVTNANVSNPTLTWLAGAWWLWRGGKL